MGEFYTYQKKRRDFGKYCNFSDSEIKLLGYYLSGQEAQSPNTWKYEPRNPNFIDLDNIAPLSEHVVNTERVQTANQGMHHKEGGWPSGIDPTEAIETGRWRKKVERDVPFTYAVKELSGTVEKCIEQNNQIDLFEEYFVDEESEHFVENISIKTLMLFKDKDTNESKPRAVSEISWYPEGPTKVAVSYAINRFQQTPEKMSLKSYVWDLQKPNDPETTLIAPSPCTNISYNFKLTDTIAGGCYNGLVCIWDVKKGSQPVSVSPVEKSHSEPITHLSWIAGKTGQDFVTCSTDGKVLWWDMRMFNAPKESLDLMMNDSENVEKRIGATVMEYNSEIPSKYLLGTENGVILCANKKTGKPVDISYKYGVDQGGHLGPIYAINRSIPNNRYFLSVGDWSAKIWFDDCKTPIINTRYHGSYLSDGCFSPSRQGVFFITRRDGWMDVWDLFYRQNELAFSHKVSDTGLTCIKLNYNNLEKGFQNQQGKYAAIGDQNGTVTLMELCESLYQPQNSEKDVLAEMFDRESRREKNLESLKKLAELKKTAAGTTGASKKDNQKDLKNAIIEKTKQDFWAQLGQENDLQAQAEDEMVENLNLKTKLPEKQINQPEEREQEQQNDLQDDE